MNKQERLRHIKIRLDAGEEGRLSPYACLSRQALRRKEEERKALGKRH